MGRRAVLRERMSSSNSEKWPAQGLPAIPDTKSPHSFLLGNTPYTSTLPVWKTHNWISLVFRQHNPQSTGLLLLDKMLIPLWHVKQSHRDRKEHKQTRKIIITLHNVSWLIDLQRTTYALSEPHTDSEGEWEGSCDSHSTDGEVEARKG